MIPRGVLRNPQSPGHRYRIRISDSPQNSDVSSSRRICSARYSDLYLAATRYLFHHTPHTRTRKRGGAAFSPLVLERLQRAMRRCFALQLRLEDVRCRKDGIDRGHIPQRQIPPTTPGVAGRAIRRIKGAWDSRSIKTEINEIRVSIMDLEALLETIFSFL